MAYDAGLAARVKKGLAPYPDVTEKQMFGGLAFMVGGHMCCGVNGDELMVRVGPDGYAAALASPHAREMDFTGKAMKGYVYVAAPGLADDDDLRSWLERAAAFVATLPAK